MEYIEINGQEVEKYTFLENDEGKARCSIEVQGEAIWTGKTKALIVIMPHYDNDTPTVINVGLELKEINQAIDIADEIYYGKDSYKAINKQLQQEVDRLQMKVDE